VPIYMWMTLTEVLRIIWGVDLRGRTFVAMTEESAMLIKQTRSTDGEK
jgi:hypothetical protein